MNLTSGTKALLWVLLGIVLSIAVVSVGYVVGSTTSVTVVEVTATSAEGWVTVPTATWLPTNTPEPTQRPTRAVDSGKEYARELAPLVLGYAEPFEHVKGLLDSYSFNEDFTDFDFQ